MDVAKVNMVEGELDALVAKRDAKRQAEEIWAQSVRTYNALRREALCWEWLRYHQRQLNNQRRMFALLEAHHHEEIVRYERLLGINYDEGGDAA